MKYFSVWIFSLIMLLGCKSSQGQQSDVTCMRVVNKSLSIVLEEKLRQRYPNAKDSIQLVMKFYLQDQKVDSIKVVKSNLSVFNIEEDEIIDKLKGTDLMCLWDVYYSGKLKPSFVTVIFNPRLVVKN